ncbi:hypothetical protein CYMTET_56995 [Cymbomonas tetramitiformis]|uniref:Uncharacterized protein n=1 Tax=Cymbomonas tetramitiformis TaxID=36881 RepID=A0AAE0EN69_9CHLO|nr:hypothetical protein CYMTET_56995 [Cymbomonas tetramitiformis]
MAARMSEVYASKWKDASGTVRMEDLFTDERLHEDVQDWLSLFQLCALKIQNEAVVEGMGSTMNRHATSVRGLTLDKEAEKGLLMSQRSRDRVGGEGMPVRLDSGGATEVDGECVRGLSVGGCAIRDFPSRMVPKRVRGLFTKCVMAALGRMRLDPEDVEAYKLILLLPRLALQPVRVDGSAMQYVKSKEDAQQGDPLGPPYLGAPLQTVLERVQKRHPEAVTMEMLKKVEKLCYFAHREQARARAAPMTSASLLCPPEAGVPAVGCAGRDGAGGNGEA